MSTCIAFAIISSLGIPVALAGAQRGAKEQQMSDALSFRAVEEQPGGGKAAGVMAWLLPLIPAGLAGVFHVLAESTQSLVFWSASVLTVFIPVPLCLVGGIFLGASRAQASPRSGKAAIVFNATALVCLVLL